MGQHDSTLEQRAGLGLPFGRRRVIRRALMRVPWRMHVARQVEFNRAAAEEIQRLSTSVKRLDDRVKALGQRIDGALLLQRDSAAIAVREQLYDVEGELRRQVGDLQIELHRLGQERTAR